jgi:hypothetical protein
MRNAEAERGPHRRLRAPVPTPARAARAHPVGSPR